VVTDPETYKLLLFRALARIEMLIRRNAELEARLAAYEYPERTRW